MNRALCFGALAACLLAACDDGSLQAFKPRPLGVVGGSAGRGAEGVGGGSAGRGAEGGDSGGGGGGGGGMANNEQAGAAGDGAISPLLLDDFEDGDTLANKPLGFWYPLNDGNGGTQGFGIEPDSSGSTSIYALRTHGSGFRDWGSAVGLDLVGDARSLDLLSYDKLCFHARVEAGSSTLISVQLVSGQEHYAREVLLSQTWTQYCLPLVDFISTTTDEALVPSGINTLLFFFRPVDPFLFWLDDVEFERG